MTPKIPKTQKPAYPHQQNKLQQIRQLFDHIPITKGLDQYPYSLFSLTDYSPPLDPKLVNAMADLLIRQIDFSQADLIISEADRGGGPLAQAVASQVNLPFILTNWYPTPIPGQIVAQAHIGFSGKGYICLNGELKHQSFIFIDDLLSTGGTAIAILNAALKAGGKPLAALFVGEKVDQGGRAKLSKAHRFPIISLVQFTAVGPYTKVNRAYEPPRL